MNEKYNMKAIQIDGKWYVKVYTKELGNVLLLDKTKDLSPMEFKEEYEANQFIVDYI